jgi:putative CocE/NonD family hydrolase
LNWIVDQPWSNGSVGATGVSYPGMAAQQLAALGHPALRAVVPMSDSYDLYGDLVFPGGMYNEAFMKNWSDIVSLLDRMPEVDLGDEVFRLQPVDADGMGALLAEAQGQHGGNLHVHQAVESNMFRDDQVIPGVTLDDMSTLSRVDDLSQSGAAVYRWASWLDAGSADGAIRQFMESFGPQRAVIGAWSHDLETNTSPFMQVGTRALPRLNVQWDEALNFFQDILVKKKPLQGRIFRYMNLTTGEWKTTSEWPIPGTTTERFYLREDGFLEEEAPATQDGEDAYTVNFESRSSDDPRWTAPLFGDTWYENRRWEDEDLLVYQTLPLTEAIEVTGYPVIHLNVASSHSDGAFIVYLEDVDQYGRVRYVTEGALRAIHRKVSDDPAPWKRPTPYHSFRSEDAMPMVSGEVAELAFGLHPTSVVFQVGHRIRIAIAGHDASAFRRVPESGTPEIRVQRSAVYPSYIELPVIR